MVRNLAVSRGPRVAPPGHEGEKRPPPPPPEAAMTFTRTQLIAALHDGEERSVLKQLSSPIAVGAQLENIRSINRKMFQRPISVPIPPSPHTTKIKAPANDNFANDNFVRHIVWEINDLPNPKQKFLFWLVAVPMMGYRCYKAGQYLHNHEAHLLLLLGQLVAHFGVLGYLALTPLT